MNLYFPRFCWRGALGRRIWASLRGTYITGTRVFRPSYSNPFPKCHFGVPGKPSASAVAAQAVPADEIHWSCSWGNPL
jgi:hypothetical protein